MVIKLEEGLTKRCTALAEQIQQGEPAAAERWAAVEGAMKELEAASVEDPGKCHGFKDGMGTSKSMGVEDWLVIFNLIWFYYVLLKCS